MKRLVLLLALVAAGSAAAAPPSIEAVAAARQHRAGVEAKALLRRFVPPRNATRLRHAPDLPANSWPVSAPPAKFASREAYWRTRAPLNSVDAFVMAHRPRGLSFQPGSNGPGFRILEFASGRKRYLDVTLLRHAGVTFIRVQADVVWIYPRSPQEKVPPAVAEIDVKSSSVSRRVTNPAKVSQIVRWLDALPVSPPGVALMCPLMAWPRIRLVFRAANGTRLASASVSPVRAGLCNPIGFSIHGKRQQPLIDASRGPGFLERVGKLLGLRLTVPRR